MLNCNVRYSSEGYGAHLRGLNNGDGSSAIEDPHVGETSTRDPLSTGMHLVERVTGALPTRLRQSYKSAVVFQIAIRLLEVCRPGT
jgi:hypothetical protein